MLCLEAVPEKQLPNFAFVNSLSHDCYSPTWELIRERSQYPPALNVLFRSRNAR